MPCQATHTFCAITELINIYLLSTENPKFFMREYSEKYNSIITIYYSYITKIHFLEYLDVQLKFLSISQRYCSYVLSTTNSRNSQTVDTNSLIYVRAYV